MKIININGKMERKIRIANTSNQTYPQDELLHKHKYCETEEHGGKQRSGQDSIGQDRTGQDRIIWSLMNQDKIRLYKIRYIPIHNNHT